MMLMAAAKVGTLSKGGTALSLSKASGVNEHI